MKITLISPYDQIYAIGIRILSSCLKRNGHNVRVIFLRNCFFDRYKKDILDEVVELSKDSGLIGISLMTNFFENSVEITQHLKSNLNIPILWGGCHPTIRPDECLDYADMLCLGEGEETVVELARRMEEGEDFYDIQGMWFRNNDAIIKNKPGSLIRDLDSIPFPDYTYEGHYILSSGHIINVDESLLMKYFSGHSAYMTLATRGCPFSCTYCCNNTFNDMWPEHKHVRKRSVGNIIRELIEVKNNLPFIGDISFEDDSFLSYSIEEIEDFCTQYKKNVDLPFSVSGITPTTLESGKLALLVDAGLASARMGIQTGSERTRKMYKRLYSNLQVETAARKLNEFKDRIPSPAYDLILDNPWEKDEDLIETLMLLTRLPTPYRLAIYSLTFYPETELYKQAKREGLIFDESKDIKSKALVGIKSSYFNKLFILVHEYASVGDRISSKQILFLTDKRLRKLGLSYLFYLILKIKVNRIPWIRDMLFKALNDIRKGDFSRISLTIKSYLKTKRL